jgi:cbb3-type cytochrome oxidase subunit 3
MIQKVLSGIGGVEVYGVIAVLLFVGVFVGVLVWVGLRPRAELEAASRLPLDEEDRARGGAGEESGGCKSHE